MIIDTRRPSRPRRHNHNLPARLLGVLRQRDNPDGVTDSELAALASVGRWQLVERCLRQLQAAGRVERSGERWCPLRKRHVATWRPT